MTSFISSISSYPSPCRRKSDLRAAQALRHLQQKYIFVRKKTSSLIPRQPGSQPRNPRSDSSSIPGTTYCPWKWVRDDDSARIPRSIMKAVCLGCAHYCRAVYYYHNVLIPKCDKTTGEKVWKWKEKKLAVAYVYDPYKWVTELEFITVSYGDYFSWYLSEKKTDSDWSERKKEKFSQSFLFEPQFHLVWSIQKRKQILNFNNTMYIIYL